MPHRLTLLIVLLLIPPILSACSDEGGRVDVVYDMEYIALPEGAQVDFMRPLRSSGGRIYIPCTVEDAAVGVKAAVYSIDGDGGGGVLDVGAGSEVTVYMSDSSGGGELSIAIQGGEKNALTAYMSEPCGGGEVSVALYGGADAKLLYTVGEDERFSLGIGDIFGVDIKRELDRLRSGGGEFVTGLACADGDIYIALGREIAVVSEDGVLGGTIKAGADVTALGYTADGAVTATLYVNGRSAVHTLDRANLMLGAEITLPAQFAGKSVALYSGEGYELYIKADDGLYGWNRGEEPTLIVDWLASDIFYSSVMNVAVVSADKFIVTGTDYEGGGADFKAVAAILTPRAADAAKKTELICAYTDAGPYYTLSRDVLRFNRSSEKYRVTLLDYSRFNTDGDGRAWTLLSADIAAGRIPDLIVVSSDIPADALISKGMLRELGGLSEKLLGCLTRESGTYIVPTNFTVNGYIGKAVNFASANIWDAEAAFGYIKGLSGEQRLINLYCGVTVFDYLTALGVDKFVDFDAGKCDFDGELFAEILDYVKNSLPTRSEAMLMYSANEAADLRDGRLMLKAAALTGLMSVKQLCEDFGVADIDELVAVGAAEINVTTAFAATTDGDAHGTAEFLTYLLSDERYESGEYMIPASKSAFDGKLEAQSQTFWFYKNGNYADADNNAERLLGDGYVKVYPTEAERNFYAAYINGAKLADTRTATILDIIWEEFNQYMETDATAEKCAENIQRRAEIYVNEIKT